MKAYSQHDQRWADRKINGTNYTLGTDGCFITCLGMLKNMDPLETLIILEKERCFNGALLISDKAAKALGLIYNGKANYRPDHDCVIECDYNSATAYVDQHFIVGLENGKIIDPLGGKTFDNSPYKIVSYRLFKNPELPTKNENLDRIIENQQALYFYMDAWKNLSKEIILKNISRTQKLAHESAELARELKT